MNSGIKVFLIHIFLIISGCALLLLGILTPFYFGGLAPMLIEVAGKDTPNLITRGKQLVANGRISPVLEFARVPGGPPLDDDLVALVQENPTFFFSGGSAPYIEEIVRRLDMDPAARINPTSIVELLTPRPHREYVRDFLSRSRNQNVRAILTNLDLKGTLLLQPVSSAAGAPLEIAILTTALLVQAEEIPRDLAGEIAALCKAAQSGETHSVAGVENFYLSMLSLGKRFQWVTLSELMRIMPGEATIERTASSLRARPDDASIITSAVLLSGTPDKVFDFIDAYGKDALEDIHHAMLAGKGGLALLLDRFSPIYRPYAWNSHLDQLQRIIVHTPLFSIALRSPSAAAFIKLLFLLTSGLCLITWIRLIAGDPEHLPPGRFNFVFTHLGNLTIAAAWAICVWLALEPEFLQQTNPQPQPPPTSLHIVVASAFENLKSDVMNNISIDQVTLLVLGLFFLLQGAIYAYSRVKIQQIKRLDATAEIKLKLLENEEHLFDSGLYVGLSGTVASLIMIALNIVQASLMAAYASTLFGIIFVAILKIFNIRPYKSELILSLNKPTDSDAPDNASAAARPLKLK